MVDQTAVAQFHDEVRDALVELAGAAGISAEIGERRRVDRGSQLEHLGLQTPIRRKRVEAGFSFTGRTDAEVLRIWDGIWRVATTADVMFAVLDHYRARITDHVDPSFWTHAMTWIERIENWAHADDLARLYSWTLAASPDEVCPVVHDWSLNTNQWKRRVAVVSLVHYSGKNAVFMPIDTVLDIVANCVGDDRATVYKAVGWVLRENMAAFPSEVTAFLHAHRSVMPAPAFRRATEKMPSDEREALRAALR